MRSVSLLLAGLLAGSGTVAASPAGSEAARVPAVDLGRLKVGPDRVVAPLRSGGSAELTLDADAQRDAERRPYRDRL